MERMKIAVVGAGGVGGYLAGKLTQQGLADVRLFARGAHLAAIRDHGLHIYDADERFVVYPDTSEPVEGERFDVIFLAVKSYDFEAASAQIAPYVDEETVVVPLANGVDHRRRIEMLLERGVVCEGCLYIISHIEAPGIIRKKSPLFYMLFGREEITPKMEALAQLLNESGLKTKLTADARYECWKKYLFIATFATLTACHRLPMDAVYREHPDEVDAVLDEVTGVANALGVPLGEAEKAKVIKQAENLPEGAKTSMQLDFEAGKRTELESLSGYVVHAAEAHGLRVPLMRNCYEKLLREEGAGA